jgi:hypothetical protein
MFAVTDRSEGTQRAVQECGDEVHEKGETHMTQFETVCRQYGGTYAPGMTANLPPYIPQERCLLGTAIYSDLDTLVKGAQMQTQTMLIQPEQPRVKTGRDQCAASGGQWSDPDVVFPEGICRGGGSYVPPPPVRPEPNIYTQPMSAAEQRRQSLVNYGLRQRWIVSRNCTGTVTPGLSAGRACTFYRTYSVMGALRPSAPALNFDQASTFVQTRIWQLSWQSGRY